MTDDRRNLRQGTIDSSADVRPAERVEYFLADPAAKVIGLYTEAIKDGLAFFRVLRAARGAKRVVVLLGGQLSPSDLDQIERGCCASASLDEGFQPFDMALAAR